MELQNIRRLGVFKMRNIGDVLVITPLLRALRETLPAARITVIVNSGTEAMLANNPHVDEVLVYQRDDDRRGLARLAHEIGFVRELRQRRFDLTLGFTEGDRTAWYSLLCGAKYRFGTTRGIKHPRPFYYTHSLYPPRGVVIHEVDKHFALLNQSPLRLRSLKPGGLCLVVSKEARMWARQQLAPLRPAKILHVHPVSRWLWKCWENQSMAEVIDWLQTERGARVVMTTGPAPQELQRARDIVALCRTKPLFFEGNLSLERIAALSAESDGYFGVDTAPMHMAAAVGVPVVALFGPTNPANWGPWTPLAQVLAKHCPCNEPASQEKCDWSRVRACLAAITVPEARAALDQLLATPKIEPPPES